MKRQDFNFELPSELIAQYPSEQRTESRLLVYEKQKQLISHQKFPDLLAYLNPNDLLVMNNTKVMKARLFGQKQSGGKVEILVERVLTGNQFIAHIRANKSPKADTVIELDADTSIVVTGRKENLFHCEMLGEESVLSVLDRLGHMPLPPYIDRDDESFDETRYQTVYAEKLGAIAAPTAGLHFDETLLAEIDARGIERAYITLHVGAGTFQPVKVDNIEEHPMHSEYLEVEKDLIEKVKATKAAGGRVIAIGTTVVRSLETIGNKPDLKPFCGETDIFIYPGYEFTLVDGMVTNFHLPESTLFMLISAFVGTDEAKRMYQEAVDDRYRFFSYGDACLLLR